MLNNPRKRKGKYASRRSHKPIQTVILLDILLAGVILLIFASFHHVIPAMRAGQFSLADWFGQEQTLPPETRAPETIPEPTILPTETVMPTETLPEETVPPPTEDLRTPWQIQFADKFTAEVVATDHSYSSPNVSIQVETVKRTIDGRQIVYHVADIYVASLEHFATYTANNEMVYFGTQDARKMVSESNAILAIDGDFLTYQKSGFMMRNGEIYLENSNGGNICVLFADGTMETYGSHSYDIEELKEQGAVQVWDFGPMLLDQDGKACTTFDTSSTVKQRNPRSAVGYYEPGHYCFVVVDGRQKGYSEGMKLDELAALFEELGCKRAYNMDGGGSAVMLFRGDVYSKQSNGANRKLGDILLIRDSETPGGN